METFKLDMSSKFEMSDLGCMTYFLGMELHQVKGEILVNQRKFASELLVKFSMESCSPVDTPLVPGIKLVKEDGHGKVDGKAYRSLIGSLLFLCTTRPDIAFTVNLLSRFMQSPSEIHLRSAKRVLKYIQGTLDLGILYSRGTVQLMGYSDADWAGSDEEMRSISGCCFTLESGVITWFLKKQTVVAQSTAEAEYVALAKCGNQTV